MASLIVKITGDASGFRGVADSITRDLNSISSRADKVGGSMSSLGASLSVGLSAPLLALGGAAVKASADMDSLKRALVTTTGSAGEAAKQFARLEEIAKLPAIGLEEAVRGSIRLQNYGLSAELAEKAMRGFSNAIGSSGGSADDTNEALRQLGQTFGRQKVTMDNLRIILERVPQAAKIIREEFGSEALADPAKALEKLGVNSEQFVTVLINRLNEAQKVAPGLKTEIENLGQEFQKTAAAVGDQLAPAIKDMIGYMSDGLKTVADFAKGFADMPKPLQQIGLAFSAFLVAAPLVITAVGTIITNFGVIAGAASTISTAVAGFATAVSTYGVATSAAIGLMAGAWVAGAAVAVYSIGTLTSALYELYAANTKLDTATNSLSFSIEKLLDRVRKQHPEVGALELQYRAGKLSAEDFSAKLRRLASGMESTTVQTPKASAKVKDFGNQLKEAGKIVVDSVAGLDAHGALSKTSLVYVEMLQRTKTALEKVKHVMVEWYMQGTPQGTQMEMQRMGLDRLASASDDYAASLKRVIEEQQEAVTSDAAKALPAALGLPQLPSVWTTGDAARQMGIETEPARAKRIADLQRNADLLREANRRGDPNVSGNMVIEAEEKLREAVEGTTRSVTRQSAAWKQVSTIATDLSRGIANAGVGLLFSRGAQVDVQKYKDEISALEEEQRKLLLSQSKGNDVTKQLAANSAKLADVNKRMADETRKASFAFRALEAGKSVIEDLAKSITRVLIEGALKRLGESLLGIGSTMGKVFGSGGTGVVKSVSGGMGDLGGAAAKAPGIGGAASAASSGIAGIVGAVGSVVSAVSGVIGNFQMAHMNTALGRIEENTRYTKIWTGEQPQSLLWCAQKSTEYLGYAVKSLDMIGLLQSQMLGLAQAGGTGGGTTINMAGAYLLTDAALDDFIERFSRRLKTQGL